MAKQVTKIILGADVSKDWIDLYHQHDHTHIRIDNNRAALNEVLKAYPHAAIAVEATNTFHELLVELAQRYGLPVYLINGYQLSHYAKSIGIRMRNDPVDARLLARYLSCEIDHLTPLGIQNPQRQHLWRLLKRRALLVKQCQQIRMSFAGLRELQPSVQSLLQHTKRVIVLIDKRLAALSKRMHWNADLARLKSMPGIGPLTSYALLAAYQAHPFRHVDAFIAFLGMDVKTKDSGKHRGKRKLTKQGDSEYRRLLFNAGMAAIRTPFYSEIYKAALQRGISSIGAIMLVARKLARLAFVLLKKQCRFDPAAFKGVCVQT